MKSYPIVCPSCKGTGFIPNADIDSTAATRSCPACQGKGWVVCNETDLNNHPLDGKYKHSITGEQYLGEDK